MIPEINALLKDPTIDWSDENSTLSNETTIPIFNADDVLQNAQLFSANNSEYIQKKLIEPLTQMLKTDTDDNNELIESLCYLFQFMFAKLQDASMSENKNDDPTLDIHPVKSGIYKLFQELSSAQSNFGRFSKSVLVSYCTSVSVNEAVLADLWSILPITIEDRMFHIKRLMSKDNTVISKYRKIHKTLCTEDTRYDTLLESTGWSELLNVILAGAFDDQVMFSDNSGEKLQKIYFSSVENIIDRFQLKISSVINIIADLMIISLEVADTEYSSTTLFSENSWKFCILMLQHLQAVCGIKPADINHLDQEGGCMELAIFLVEKINILSNSAHDSSSEKAVSCCLQAVCFLLKAGLVSFQSIYSGLSPDDATMHQYFEFYLKELKQMEIDSEKTSSALATAAALSNEDDTGSQLISKDAASFGLKSGDVAPASNTKSPDEIDAKLAELEKKRAKNDIIGKTNNCLKLLFLKKLLENGCYTPSIYLLKKYKFAHFQDPSLQTLCFRMFASMMSPISVHPDIKQFSLEERSLPRVDYAEIVMLHSAQQTLLKKSSDPLDISKTPYKVVDLFSEWSDQLPKIRDTEELIKYSHEFLFLLSPRLDYDGGEAIIQTIVNYALKRLSETPTASEEWFKFFRKFLFPSMIFNNVSVNNLLYKVMSFFPISERYLLYSELTEKLIDVNIHMKICYSMSEKDMKNFLKMVSYDKESSQCRRFANYANTNPVAVFDFVLTTIENFDKVSSILVSAAKFFSPYALDVLQFSLLKRLSKSRETVSPDGINMAPWFQNLTNFIAEIIKTQPRFHCYLLLEYIINNMDKGEYSATFMLKTIVEKVSGIQVLEEVQEQILILLNSDECLQKMARANIMDTRENNKAIANSLLQNFLQCSSNAFSVIMVYLQQYLRSVFDDRVDEKITSNRYDDAHSILWTFTEFCKYFMSADEFASTIFSFSSMIDKHDMAIPWAFHIWRAVLTRSNSFEDSMAIAKQSSYLAKSFGNDFDFFSSFWLGGLKTMLFDQSVYQFSEKYKNKVTNEHLESAKSNHMQVRLEFVTFTKNLKQQWTTELTSREAYTLLTKCILPRAQFGLEDAFFANEFLFCFFDNNEICVIMDVLFESLFASELVSLTSASVAYFGFFMKKCFEKLLDIKETLPKENILCQKLLLWSCSLTSNVAHMLTSDVYMFTRNCIQFMSKVVFTFPVLQVHVSLLIEAVEERLQTEQRNDIITPCKTLLGFLKTQYGKSVSAFDFCTISENESKEYRFFETASQALRASQLYKQELAGFRKEDEMELIRRKKEEENALALKKRLEEEAVAKKKKETELAAKKAEEELIAKKKSEDEELEKNKAKEEEATRVALRREAQLKEIQERKEHLEKSRKRQLNEDLPVASKKLKTEISPQDVAKYRNLASDVIGILRRDALQGEGVSKVIASLESYDMYVKIRSIVENPPRNYVEQFINALSFALKSYFINKIPDTFREFSNKLKFVLESNSKNLDSASAVRLLSSLKQIEHYMSKFKNSNVSASSNPSTGRVKVSETTARAPVGSRFNATKPESTATTNSVNSRNPVPTNTRSSDLQSRPSQNHAATQRQPVSTTSKSSRDRNRSSDPHRSSRRDFPKPSREGDRTKLSDSREGRERRRENESRAGRQSSSYDSGKESRFSNSYRGSRQ
ncbi:THO complex subunit 2 [Hanseniaspora osmophila]|uniref:THO complex subunit 2 n=1 Tax=Hanseniaspora osmophila TaxID=56408 RepID=A0A1E5RNZ0_9ASCO|nr:THO complex subunit 2 [Hanseniaspora osmophila]